MIRWIFGKTGKTEAQDVQTPPWLSGASHQKQSGKLILNLILDKNTYLLRAFRLLGQKK